MQITTIPALSDNYIYLISWGRNAIVIDPSEAQPVLDELQKSGLNLLHILNTHHHSDHIGGNELIKKQTGCTIIAPDDKRIKKDEIAKEGKDLHIDHVTIQVISVPGHTTSHIAYYLPEEKWLFSGDSLFLGGCGRIFEGTPEQMHRSLTKLTKLPLETQIYCGHEYTKKNLEFAQSIEPDNQDVKKRLAAVKSMSQTIPGRLEEELLTNPFLRVNAPSLKKVLHMENATDVEVFATIRKMKDDY